MKRRAVKLLWVLAVLALVAAACGNDDDASGDGADTEATAEATEEPTTDEEPAEEEPTEEMTEEMTEEEPTESAATDVDLGNVKIGLVGFLSGPLAVLGTSQQNSMQAQLNLVEQSGLLGSTTFELVAIDAPDPGAAAQAVQELSADPDVALIVGPSITAFYAAAAPIFEDSQTVNCQPAVAGDVGFGTELAYGFRTQPTAGVDLDRLLPFLAEQGNTTIGLVYENDDTGAEYDATLQATAGDHGLEYLGYQATNTDDQTHRAYLEALADADVVIVSNQPAGAGKSALAAAEIGFEGTLAGGSGLQAAGFIEPAGDAAIGSVFVSWPLDYYTRIPEADWRTGYAAHVAEVLAISDEVTAPNTGRTFYQGTTPAADCVQLWAEAAAAAGSAEAEAVVSAWEGLTVSPGVLPSDAAPVFSGEDHDALDGEHLVVYTWQQDDDGWYLEEVG